MTVSKDCAGPYFVSFVLEGLNVSGMMQNCKLARAIADAG
ncbi:hypothetical protein FLM9_1228 [Candidatus Synechococcus spongiarum]|uniref:Uncharacterized protein n=1 Tax=Candidatus Synechococcus spongiarum TaxID=431041 RepID=A0A164Z5W0_9SYNE|nr:hypothetical protein FLM9_1228 [Candidatus Synechococcus spongiarum]